MLLIRSKVAYVRHANNIEHRIINHRFLDWVQKLVVVIYRLYFKTNKLDQEEKHKVSLKNIFIEVVLVYNNNTQQVQNIKNVNNTNKK